VEGVGGGLARRSVSYSDLHVLQMLLRPEAFEQSR